MIKDGQVRELLRLVNTGKCLAFAARKTGMDEKTARKYRQGGELPSQRTTPRLWRTRVDPFETVWPLVQKQLQQEPSLQAVTLFRWVQEQHPGEHPDSQRRTFERKVRRWRATEGPNQKVMFAQVHHAGDLAASDFTHMDSLGVTIAGQSFPHLLYHLVLTYSNWESVTLCPSESFEALSEGFQNALWELGGVPRGHRSDSLSAAVNNLSDEREFSQRYQELLEYYGLEGQRTNARQPHENGDAESSHRHFKEAVDQALRLRGSRDFSSRGEYVEFLRSLVARRNAEREPRCREELAALRALPLQRQDSRRRLSGIGVGAGSTIQVQRNTYSVPSRLIGQKVQVVVGVDEVEVWYAEQLIQRMPRLSGRGQQYINYRHVIDSLVRKPGAFANYVYREELFPSSHFRMAYDALCEQHAERVATREYLRILQLAARENETAVQDALRAALTGGEKISFAAVEAAVQSTQQVPALTEVQVEAPDLRAFDSLLDHHDMEVESHEFLIEPVPSVPVLGCEPHAAIAGTTAVSAGEPDVPHGECLTAVPGRHECGVTGTLPGASAADVPGALSTPGGAGRAGDAESHAVPGGTDPAGMPEPAHAADPAAAGAIAASAFEELGDVRLAADSAGGDASSGEPARRLVPGPPREPAGIRQAGLGQDALRVCPGRAVGAARPCAAVHHQRPVGAESAGSQTRPAVTESAQATIPVRGPGPGRPGVCAAQPRGDGGAVHAAGRALRAGQCPADEQPAVFAVGADFQRRDDDGGGHRPLGASLRDLGVERAQLSLGDCPAESTQGFPASPRPAGSLRPLAETGNFNCR